MMITVQNDDFDAGAELASLRQQSGDPGAIVSFTGLVREFYYSADADKQKIKELYLEHYPGMTEKALKEIVDEAIRRWDIQAIRVIHRVGTLKPGDQIVFVAAASAHRHEAFSAAEFVMDYLKTKAPFWKRESTERGIRWVSHRHSDEVAAERWQPTGFSG
ncbi:MAG: molybdopterin synthase catalytic subunit MoaE [Pseudohongiellaceae bacterium]